MYASCGLRGLKHVIYAERTNHVHMMRPLTPEPQPDASELEVPHTLHFVDMPAGYVMLDTGCKTSVGGSEWHQALQAELDALGVAYASEDQLEYFKFGDGTTVPSTRSWTYSLAVSGLLAYVKIAEVPGALPGLLSPDAIRQFALQVDFAELKWRVPKGQWKPLQFTDSGHIRLPVLQHPSGINMMDQAAYESADSSKADSADEMCQGQPWLASQSSDSASQDDASSTTSESQHDGATDQVTTSSSDASE